MSKIVKIAVDAMGGSNSPDKVIDGIIHHNKNSKDVFYKIFGDKNKIFKIAKEIKSDHYEIIHTDEKIEDTDTPLGAAKKEKKQVCG